MSRSTKKPKIVLSLSGGGDRTYLLAGIVYGLHEVFDLVHINVVSGSSYSVPLTLRAKTLSDALNRLHYFSILNYVTEVPDDQLLEKHGLFELKPDIAKTLTILTGISRVKNSRITPIVTEITPYGLFPRILDVSYGKAAAISMSFPFLIAPTKIRDKYFTDGGASGQIHFGNLVKYSNKYPIIGLSLSSTQMSLIKTLQKGLSVLELPTFRTLKRLYTLYQKDRLLEIFRKISIAKYSGSNLSNMTFNITNITEEMILPHSKKRKLFLEGYVISQTIASKIKYFIAANEWRHLKGHTIYIDRSTINDSNERDDYFIKSDLNIEAALNYIKGIE